MKSELLPAEKIGTIPAFFHDWTIGRNQSLSIGFPPHELLMISGAFSGWGFPASSVGASSHSAASKMSESYPVSPVKARADIQFAPGATPTLFVPSGS